MSKPGASTTTPTVNTELIRKVMAHIREHPGQWDQHTWDRRVDGLCGTAHCFGGWVLELGGRRDVLDAFHKWRPHAGPLPKPWPAEVAQELLGLTARQAERLFLDGFQDTLDEFEERVTRVTGVTFGDET